MQTRERAELIAEIQTVFETWQVTHGAESCAIHALDALGYMAGCIFSQAPDVECRAHGREHFMMAIDEGMNGTTVLPLSELH